MLKNTCDIPSAKSDSTEMHMTHKTHANRVRIGPNRVRNVSPVDCAVMHCQHFTVSCMHLYQVSQQTTTTAAAAANNTVHSKCSQQHCSQQQRTICNRLITGTLPSRCNRVSRIFRFLITKGFLILITIPRTSRDTCCLCLLGAPCCVQTQV